MLLPFHLARKVPLFVIPRFDTVMPYRRLSSHCPYDRSSGCTQKHILPKRNKAELAP